MNRRNPKHRPKIRYQQPPICFSSTLHTVSYQTLFRAWSLKILSSQAFHLSHSSFLSAQQTATSTYFSVAAGSDSRGCCRHPKSVSISCDLACLPASLPYPKGQPESIGPRHPARLSAPAVPACFPRNARAAGGRREPAAGPRAGSSAVATGHARRHAQPSSLVWPEAIPAGRRRIRRLRAGTGGRLTGPPVRTTAAAGAVRVAFGTDPSAGPPALRRRCGPSAPSRLGAARTA